MMKKTLAFLPVMLVFSCVVYAQQPALYRQYATQAHMKAVSAANPQMAETRSAIERHTYSFRQYGSIDTVFIPVVFHIFDNGKDKPINKQDILEQLARLNLDFFYAAHPYLSDDYKYDKKNDEGQDAKKYLHKADKAEGFAQRAGGPLIRFCLPQTDPQGVNTDGMVYAPSLKSGWTRSDSIQKPAFGGVAAWDPARYCNIWVTRLYGDIAGYAQMPGGPVATDGIVIDERYFLRKKDPGAPAGQYDGGRTLVHLMGSYLNLYELWNDDQPCADDYVEDTPIHNAPNYTLDTYRHVSTCDGNPVEMTMNLMDNTIDSAQYMFTWGQAIRMQACLAKEGPRYTLRQTALACDGAVQPQDMAEEREDPSLAPAETPAWSVRVLPNPANGDFMIVFGEGSNASAEIRVFDPAGRMVWQDRRASAEGGVRQLVAAARWSPGLYTVQVRLGAAQQAVKVLLER